MTIYISYQHIRRFPFWTEIRLYIIGYNDYIIYAFVTLTLIEEYKPRFQTWLYESNIIEYITTVRNGYMYTMKTNIIEGDK
jgi:hypothetical protein